MIGFIVSVAFALSSVLPASGAQVSVCTTGACPSGYKMVCSGEEGTRVCFCVQPGPVDCTIFNCRG